VGIGTGSVEGLYFCLCPDIVPDAKSIHETLEELGIVPGSGTIFMRTTNESSSF